MFKSFIQHYWLLSSLILSIGCTRSVAPTPTLSVPLIPTYASESIEITQQTSTLEDASVQEVQTIAETDATVDVVQPEVERFRGQPVDELLETMATGVVVRRHQRFSSTTAVYHLELEGGVHIAFKPSTRTQLDLWRHEVAAYRLGRMLGLTDRVPPVVSRRIPLSVFGQDGIRDQLAHAPDDPTTVLGAAVYWYPVLRIPPVAAPEQQALWQPWLQIGARIPSRSQLRAEEISTLLLFDYLQGNNDRWRVGNVRSDESDRLVYRDNNDGWGFSHLRYVGFLSDRLHMTQRFRQSVVTALEQATSDALRTEIAREPGPVANILTDAQLQAYEHRRQFALGYIRRLVRSYGSRRVFVW